MVVLLPAAEEDGDRESRTDCADLSIARQVEQVEQVEQGGETPDGVQVDRRMDSTCADVNLTKGATRTPASFRAVIAGIVKATLPPLHCCYAPAVSDTTAPDPAAPNAAAIRRPLLLVLASLAALAPVATDLYLPGFPAMEDTFGTDASGVQLTLTAFLVGMAFGQLIMGPLSDRFGRRGPLIVSSAVCVVAGAVCASAPSLAVLVVARLVQGFAGAGGMVIGRAVISDLLIGRAAAKAFTLMLTVGGVAPVLAPLIGGLLADPVGWRGMLWAVTVLSIVMLVGVLVVVKETHPGQARSQRGTPWRAGIGTVLSTRAYRGPVAVFALTFAVMLAYVSSSPFVYQDVIGLSELQYGFAFGLNAFGLIYAGWMTSRLVDRWTPRQLIRAAMSVQVLATITFLGLAFADAPSWIFTIPIFVAVTSTGVIMGPSAALAMGQVRSVAGSGSAVLGFTQFTLGAVVSPLVGLGGAESATVPASVMATASVLGFLVSRLGLSIQPESVSVALDANLRSAPSPG